MRVLLIHLSDLHFRENSGFIADASSIANAAASAAITASRNACFVIVSGDVAYSGRLGEYAVAEAFLDQLALALSAHHNFAAIQFVVVPGNHDCDFSSDQSVRDILLSQVQSGGDVPTSENYLSQLLQPQEHFFAFHSRVTGRELAPSAEKLFHIESYDSPPIKLNFNCINTAWISQLHERQGSLFYPIGLLPRPADTQAINITVFHHPYNWLPADNARKLRTYVEGFSDIVLTGHEHESSQFARTDTIDSTSNEYFEGGALNGHTYAETSSFNVFVIDTDVFTFEYTTFALTGSIYCQTATTPSPRPFGRTRQRLLSTYEIRESFSKFLLDAGASFSHPNVDRLTLDDIFTAPDLQEIKVTGKKSSRYTESIVSGSSLAPYLLSQRRTLIVGPEQSGKTALAKIIFVALHRDGTIPVYVKASAFSSPKERSVVEQIGRCYVEQYASPELERFRQLPLGEKAVIVDDFHECRLNRSGQQELLSLLGSIFGTVVLVGSDTLLVSEMSDESRVLADSGCLEILEFGHRLTERLIEKWVNVGQEYTVSERALLERVIQMKTVLDSVVGRALIPRRPIYLLILLQQIETNTQLDCASGSLGYLYEALVTQQLSKAVRTYSLDTLHNYLAELAYTIFESGTKHITESDIRQFHNRYTQTYRIGLDQSNLLKDLEKLFILCQQSDVYRFHYKYLYYFFVAKHLANHITDSPIRSHLDRMTEHLHRDDYSTILLFTAYFVRDSYLLDRVLYNARKLFAQYDPCDFEGHVDFVNRLQRDFPRFILPGKDTRSRREEAHKKIDEMENEMRSAGHQEQLDLDGGREQAEVLNIARAFKAVQILGQILRNFPGSLRGDIKLELAKEAYLLGLRTLNGLLSMVEQNMEFLVTELSGVLGSKAATQEERHDKATQLLCYLMELVSFVVVKRISWSVGSRHLVETYEDVLAESESLAVRLVDLSIKLDHFTTFPEQSISDLHRHVEGNPFAEMTLRQLVAQHLYLYPTDYRVTQRVCSKLGIAFKDIKARQRLKKIS